MKNIKKLSVTFLASTMMLAGFGTFISADEKSTTVSYSMSESYTWTIPDTIDLSGTESSSKQVGTIAVSDCHLNPGHKLKITYTSGNPTAVVSKDDNQTSYGFKIGDDSSLTSDYTFSGGVKVMEVPADYSDSDLSTTLYGKLTESNPKTAGTYEATVSFTATIV